MELFNQNTIGKFYLLSCKNKDIINIFSIKLKKTDSSFVTKPNNINQSSNCCTRVENEPAATT